MTKEWTSIESMEADLKKLEESKKKKQEMTEEEKAEKALKQEFFKMRLEWLTGKKPERIIKDLAIVEKALKGKEEQIEILKKQFKKDLEGVTPETAEAIIKKYRQLYADIFS